VDPFLLLLWWNQDRNTVMVEKKRRRRGEEEEDNAAASGNWNYKVDVEGAWWACMSLLLLLVGLEHSLSGRVRQGRVKVLLECLLSGQGRRWIMLSFLSFTHQAATGCCVPGEAVQRDKGAAPMPRAACICA
jgi:hypothetical protein